MCKFPTSDAYLANQQSIALTLVLVVGESLLTAKHPAIVAAAAAVTVTTWGDEGPSTTSSNCFHQQPSSSVQRYEYRYFAEIPGCDP